MFMFRSKREALTKKLLKAGKQRRSAADAVRHPDDESSVRALLNELRENQLKMLWQAVEDRHRSGCVLLEAHRPPDTQRPHVLCCRTWRWPDLDQNAELRRLPCCRSSADTVYVCCNPYHWSRVHDSGEENCAIMMRIDRDTFVPCFLDGTQEAPPPYRRYDSISRDPVIMDEIPAMPHEFPGSLTTNGEGSNVNPRKWCEVKYWEMAKRVGPVMGLEIPAVNIFGDVPYGNGFSLETFAQKIEKPPEEVRQARCKIGFGVTLSREDNRVWLYNHSNYPVFVYSLTLDTVDMQTPTRIAPECCLCVFDPSRLDATRMYIAANRLRGPIDPQSIQISFGKGWGPGYSRPEITACPCRLEVLLSPCR